MYIIHNIHIYLHINVPFYIQPCSRMDPQELDINHECLVVTFIFLTLVKLHKWSNEKRVVFQCDWVKYVLGYKYHHPEL